MEYGDVGYWQERYGRQRDACFEWLADYKRIKAALGSWLPPPSGTDSTMAILVPGCGNSRLSFDLHHDGYTQVISVDYSPAAIDSMREMARVKGIDTDRMAFEVADCTDLSLLDSHRFDVVLDKSTLDAICCSDDGQKRSSADLNRNALRYLAEMHRVLKPGGVLLVLSFSIERADYFHATQHLWTVPVDVRLFSHTDADDESENIDGNTVAVCHRPQIRHAIYRVIKR